MDDHYITASETIILSIILFGPWIIIGVILQLAIYQYFSLLNKENRFITICSTIISSLFSAMLSFYIWMKFPSLAKDIVSSDGVVSTTFLPAIIGCLIVFPIISFLTIKLRNN